MSERGSEPQESDSQESDSQEAGWQESESQESDSQEAGSQESGSQESDSQESDSQESDSQESDSQESDSQESDAHEPEQAGAAGDGLDDLFFDRAEGAVGASPGAPPCGRCHGSLAGSYHDADGHLLCATCARLVIHGEPGDSGLMRLLRAGGLGLVAAAFSGLVWWGVREATGWELGLLAVGVGLAVGFAVRIGARGRGGWLYQALAMALTYLAIVSTYVPPIMAELRAPAPVDLEAGPQAAPAEPLPPPPAALVFVVACVLAPFAPFLAGLENIIGILLIGFALWEAWRVNKRPYKRVTGPYPIASAPA